MKITTKGQVTIPKISGSDMAFFRERKLNLPKPMAKSGFARLRDRGAAVGDWLPSSEAALPRS